MSITVTDFFNNSLIEDALAGALSGCSIGLYTNTPGVNRGTQITDLVEPTYTGYARKPVTFETVFRDNQGNYVAQGLLADFQMSNNNTPTVCNGYFLCASGSGTPLLVIEPFSTPLNLADDLSAIIVSPEVYIGNGNVSGDASVIGG